MKDGLSHNLSALTCSVTLAPEDVLRARHISRDRRCGGSARSRCRVYLFNHGGSSKTMKANDIRFVVV